MLVLVIIELVINIVVFIKLNKVYPFLSLFNQSSSCKMFIFWLTLAQKKDIRIVPSYIVTTWGDSPYNVKKAHLDLVSRMTTVETATMVPQLTSQFASEISNSKQDIPETVTVKKQEVKTEEKPKESKPEPQPESKPESKPEDKPEDKPVLRSDPKPAEPVETKPVNKEAEGTLESLFFFPNSEITHSSRALGYGSYPFGSRFSKLERKQSDSIMDRAIQDGNSEPYTLTPTPLEKKKEMWATALSQGTFRLHSRLFYNHYKSLTISIFQYFNISCLEYKPTSDIINHAYTIRSNLHLKNYQRMEFDLYNALGMPFSYASPDNFPANSYGPRASVLISPAICHNSPRFVFVVLSHPNHFRERVAIRRTWGHFKSMMGYRMKVVFAMGISNAEVVDHELRYEALRHDDIIVLNYHDNDKVTTGNTIALMHALRWVTNTCNRVKYIVKTQDDSYLNLKVLIKQVTDLQSASHRKFYFGSCVKDNWEYIQDPAHSQYVPPELVKDETQRFGWCSGSAWVISHDLAPAISLTSMFVPWLSNAEDVEVGKILSLWGVTPYDYYSNRFAKIHISQNTGALWDYMGYSGMSPADLLDAVL